MKTLKNKEGQGLVEYIVLICLVAVALFAIVQQMGNSTHTAFVKADNMISSL